MERHKLWNDRAEKLMKKTFESWSKGKKKKVTSQSGGKTMMQVDRGNAFKPYSQLINQ